jgi:hypothetical protein
MDDTDLISAGTALMLLGMIWLRTRMHYARSVRGPMKLQPAGKIYFAIVIALLLLGWVAAPWLGRTFSPTTPSAFLRGAWFLAIYFLFIPIHRILKARGVEVFKSA